MCSLQPADEELDSLVGGYGIERDAPCVKCKIEPASVNIRFAVYCDRCFAEQAHHKYRAQVGKTRPRSTRERIILALNSRQAEQSLVLLLMACETPRESRHSDTFFCISFGEIEAVQQLCHKNSIEHHTFELPKVSSTTAEQDLLTAYQTHRTVEMAKRLRADKIYMPDTCNDLAADLFKLTVKGMGYAVPWEQQAIRSISGVGFVRPLREHHRTEVLEYLRVRGVRHNYESSPYDANTKSLNDLTEAFLLGLDRGFSATVSTVCKTAGKVRTDWSDNRSRYDSCMICLRPCLEALGARCYACETALEESDPDKLSDDLRDLIRLVPPSSLV